MAFILKDRVKESTTTTGTGNISLGGALATFDTFQTYLSNGDTTFYAIAHTSSGVDEWEVGLGTWNTGNTLSRTTVLAGSNGTSAVTFSAGTKDVFMTYPASKAIVSGEDAAFANITVTGTVDGRDIAADGTKLDAIEASADVTDTTNVTSAGALMRSGGTMTGNLVLNANPSAALGAATKQYVDAEVSSLVDSAPSTLDTLNELAAALGDDANFSTTVTNSIATKLPLAGGTLTGNLSMGDNDKAIFGAGSDLQIYHSGSDSFIDDAGTGNLNIRGSSIVQIGKYTGEVAAQFVADGEVSLRYNNSEKLATTSTGVDITGTLTSDVLTVDGTGVVGTFSSSNNNTVLRVKGNGATNGGAIGSTSADDLVLLSGLTEKMRITSAGLVGIGTDSPASDAQLSISAPEAPHIYFERSNSGRYDSAIGMPSSGAIAFYLGANSATVSGLSERMRLTSAGDLELIQSNNLYWKHQGGGTIRAGITADSSDNLMFSTGSSDSTAMTIDGSGNLLLGKTSASGTSASSGGDGLEIRPTYFSFQSNTVASYLNTRTDGDISVFQKDGTTVGSIATVGGRLGIGTGDAGLFFDDDNNRIGPVTMASGTPVDSNGLLDLGYASAKFRDLHLSGAVNAATGTYSGDVQAAGLYVGATNTSYDFYNNGTSYLNGATTIDANTTINGVTFKSGSNVTRNLKIQPTGSDTTVGLSMYTPSGSHSIQLYGGTTTYGFLDGNWGNWDIQKQKNGAFKVDEGSGLQRVFNDGYHPNADAWTTSRTLSLTGDVTGSVSWDGSGNASLAATVADDSHNHTISNIDNLSVGSLTGMRLTTTSGYIEFGPANASWAHIYTDRPNFYFNQELYVNNQRVFHTGYHPNADTLTTARTINGVSFDGSANITIADSTKLPLSGGTMTGTLSLQSQKIQFIGGAGGSTFASNHYSMGIDIANGSWSGPNYSDLIIGYHTGIRLGAAYSGIRFYNNSPTTDTNNTGNGNGGEALIMTVGGTQGSHVNIENNLNVGGTALATASHRAPIFYDSNDTAYYVDPASTSDSALRVRGGALFGANATWGDYLMVGGNGRNNYINNTTTASVATTDGNLHLDAASGHDTYINFYDGNNVYFGNGSTGQVGKITNAGVAQFATFTDNNNTAYYVDPASTSNLVRTDMQELNVNGGTRNNSNDATVYVTATNNADWGLVVDKYNGSSSEYGVDIRMGSSFSYGLRVLGAGSTVSGISSAQLFHNSSVRGPIFYDSDNTAYYVDPASTGSSVRIRGNIDTRTQDSTTQNNQLYFGINNGNSAGTSNEIGTGITWAPLYSSYSKRSAGILQIGEGNYFRSGLAFYTNNTADATTDWVERMRLDMDGNLIIKQQSVRAPIFYDYNDTTYYTNPANNSVMNQISLGVPGNGSNTKGRFIALEGNTDSSGEASGRIFFTEHNSSTANMDAYGMSLGYRGGATSITGTSGNVWTGLSQIANGQWGMWGHNADNTGALVMYGDRAATYVNFSSNDISGIGTGTASGSFRAPLFYDSNDTAYYVNPNGTSRLSQIDFGDSSPTLSGNQDYLQIQTSYGYIQAGPANSSYAHFHTDRPQFYFGQEVIVDGGGIRMYDSGADVRAYAFYDQANTAYYFDGSATGDSIRVAGNIVAYYSDERLKDIEGNIDSPLEKVYQLNGFYYTANKKAQTLGYKDNRQVGVSAQQVEAVMPEVVTDAAIGHGYKTVDYAKLVPLLIEAVKEQQDQIETLKSRLEQLEN